MRKDVKKVGKTSLVGNAFCGPNNKPDEVTGENERMPNPHFILCFEWARVRALRGDVRVDRISLNYREEDGGH